MADDSTDTASGPVFRLVYRSHLRIPDHQVKAELGAIFSKARSNNKRQGITGALLVWNDHVVQTLEGDETAVRALSVTILETQEVQGILGRDVHSVTDEDMGRIVDILVDGEGR